MFRRLWAKISGSEPNVCIEGEESHDNAVVPLRRRDKHGREIAENLVVTKKDNVERLHEAVNRLVEKLEGIHDHLGSQVSQNEQLLSHIQRLPELMQNVPDSMRRQEAAVQSLTEELRRKAQSDTVLAEKLATLPGEAAKQTQALEEIGKQIFASHRMEEAMSEHFAGLAQAVNRLDGSTVHQTEWIQRMSRSFSDTDRYLKDMMIRQQKRMLWIYLVTVGVCLVAIAGLTAAIFVLRGGQ